MKQKVKIILDSMMLVCLLGLNGYQFFSERAHEYLGILIFILFILHNIMNFQWYQKLSKGRYSPIRFVYFIVNFMLLLCMLVQMYSGIAMSKYAFSFLDMHQSLSLMRKLHLLGAYWSFVFIGLHLGLHWSSFAKKIKKHMPNSLMKVLAVVIPMYGIYAFIKRDFFSYLTLSKEFVFMDYSEPIVMFLIDYIAILGLCVCIAYLIIRYLSKEKRQ